MATTRRFVLQKLLPAVAAGGTVVTFLALGWREMVKLEPPSEGCSLREFLDAVQPPAEVRLFEARGGEYLEGVGRLPPSWTVPSGPPGYVFDRSGRLVSWTYDRGDSPMYLDEWDHFPSARPVTVAEALAWVKEPNEESRGREPVTGEPRGD